MLEITLFLFNVLLIVVIVAAYVKLTYMIKNQGLQIQLLLKHDKEGFRIKEGMAPAQRYGMAAKYTGMENGLMPSFNQNTKKSKYRQAMTSERGDRSMSYMLPGANSDATIGGEEINSSSTNDEAVTSALNVTQEDLIKAGAGAISATDFHDNSTPDTSELPATVQTGLVDANKEGYCGGNTRVCPGFLDNGSFVVSHKNQKDGISTSREGFRPRNRYT